MPRMVDTATGDITIEVTEPEVEHYRVRGFRPLAEPDSADQPAAPEAAAPIPEPAATEEPLSPDRRRLT